MTTTTTTETTCTPGTTYSWDAVSWPGCYVCNSTGWLFRVPEHCFDENGKPWMNFEYNTSCEFTFISSNPLCETTEARSVAKEWGVSCSF